LILYEASRTDPDRVQLEGTQTILHAAKAYVFATNELCDLASREASAVDRRTTDFSGLGRTLATLSGGRAQSAGDSRSLELSMRALGHGASAGCYLQRGQDAQMKEELRRFIDALHGLGVPPEETGVVRAFLAYENGDVAGARRALADGRRMRDLDPDTRRSIDEMDRALVQGDRALVRRTFNRGQLATLTGRVVFRQVQRTGALDGVKDSAPARGVARFLTGTTQAIDAARVTLGGVATEPARRARGLLDGVRR
jgi:hypothetical protein